MYVRQAYNSPFSFSNFSSFYFPFLLHPPGQESFSVASFGYDKRADCGGSENFGSAQGQVCVTFQ